MVLTEDRSEQKTGLKSSSQKQLVLEDTFEGRPLFAGDKLHRKTGNRTQHLTQYEDE